MLVLCTDPIHDLEFLRCLDENYRDVLKKTMNLLQNKIINFLVLVNVETRHYQAKNVNFLREH